MIELPAVRASIDSDSGKLRIIDQSGDNEVCGLTWRPREEGAWIAACAVATGGVATFSQSESDKLQRGEKV